MHNNQANTRSGANGSAAHDPAIEHDPFDPQSLRLPQDFGDVGEVKKVITTVPVRTPAGEWWVRVHPDEGYRMPFAILDLKEVREKYIVVPEIARQIPGECSPRILYTATNRQNVLFLWPVRAASSDGRIDNWSRSAMEGVHRGTTTWVRVKSNLALGAYEIFSASGEIPEPEWPEISFKDVLKIAFRDRLIDRFDHPVLQQLRGER